MCMKNNYFAIVAHACEELNSFAIILRERQIDAFYSVTTETNLRQYVSGWMFEKYVEAQLNPDEGYVAVWGLELSEEKGEWRIVANNSISYTDYYEEVAVKIVPENKLEEGLTQVVRALMDSYVLGNVFRAKIDKLLEESKKRGVV